MGVGVRAGMRGGSKGERKVPLSVSLCRFPVGAGGGRTDEHEAPYSEISRVSPGSSSHKHSQLSSVKSRFRFIWLGCSSELLFWPNRMVSRRGADGNIAFSGCGEVGGMGGWVGRWVGSKGVFLCFKIVD